MRYLVLILILLMSLPFCVQNVNADQSSVQKNGTLIRSIDIEGFVLGDKNQFLRLFKPYRNKYLTAADMDVILSQVQIIYEREGYQQLVSISYQVNKHRLVFTVLMTS